MQIGLKFRMPLLNKDGSFKEWFYWGWGVGVEDEFTGPHSGYRKCPSQRFTGLQDNSHPPKDIFEGDIFEIASNQRYDVRFCTGEESNNEWYGGTFILWRSEETFFPFDEYAMKHGRVIGNTTENPELLK